MVPSFQPLMKIVKHSVKKWIAFLRLFTAFCAGEMAGAVESVSSSARMDGASELGKLGAISTSPSFLASGFSSYDISTSSDHLLRERHT